jgi:hypothetical protein
MDKLKNAGASVKEAGANAAERAKLELDERKTRGDLAEQYEALGRKAYELARAGDVKPSDMATEMEEIRKLEAHLAEVLAAEQAQADEERAERESHAAAGTKT